MKKIFLAIIAMASLQIGFCQDITYGVKGGLNLSKFVLNFDSPLDYKYKIGYQIGGFVKIKVTDNLYVQPELLYILQGAKYDTNLTSILLPQDQVDPLFNINFNGKSSESTIILPVMLKYYITEKFNVELGPQLDYLFYVKEDNNREVTTNEDVIAIDKSRSASDFNFGLDLGIGYDFTSKIGLGLRYNYGLNRLFDGELSRFNNGFKLKNSVFQLSLEYRLN